MNSMRQLLDKTTELLDKIRTLLEFSKDLHPNKLEKVY